jgi:chromosome segregation ATPase
LRDELRDEIAAQRDQLAQEREREQTALAADLKAQHTEAQSQLTATRAEINGLQERLEQLRSEVVTTEEVALLQEAGIYEYHHPLSDAVAYQERLGTLREQIKAMTRKGGGAVLGATNWTVNGSASQGRAMVRDFSKLMLRAYNAEADNLVRSLKPYKLEASAERLTKVATTIVKLGKTMDIRISDPYHRLRIQELELTADFRAKQAEEKEREREEQARLREERKAQQELQRERERLEKERQHYENALAALQAKADEEGAHRMREQLAEIDRAIQDVDYRAANIRAGYVYVISNLGSFGDRIVKIGMTRRLEPLDRVRELGDASVPFRYDVHALFFSDDAVGIEAKLHERLADRRVNRVNLRREFFYATPAEVKVHLQELAGELLQYEEVPEALEFRQGSHA